MACVDTGIQVKGVRRAIVAILVLMFWVAVYAVQASQILRIRAFEVSLPGTTATTEPDLAGVVLHDATIDFQIRGADGGLLYQGILQNRVVRANSSGRLHFYYRIRHTVGGLPGRVSRITTEDFSGFDPLYVDYRLDGLGVVAPKSAYRGPDPGALVGFNFPSPGLAGGTESRFFFVKTGAAAFRPGGTTTLWLDVIHHTSVPTVRPVP